MGKVIDIFAGFEFSEADRLACWRRLLPLSSAQRRARIRALEAKRKELEACDEQG